VQREAKRVADLAAAAVMAAAAGGGDTGEYAKIPVRQLAEPLPTQPDSSTAADAESHPVRREEPEQA
jgi:predicted alpha-1,6-mannanase (GH76 family)